MSNLVWLLSSEGLDLLPFRILEVLTGACGELRQVGKIYAPHVFKVTTHDVFSTVDVESK